MYTVGEGEGRRGHPKDGDALIEEEIRRRGQVGFKLVKLEMPQFPPTGNTQPVTGHTA